MFFGRRGPFDRAYGTIFHSEPFLRIIDVPLLFVHMLSDVHLSLYLCLDVLLNLRHPLFNDPVLWIAAFYS